MLTGYGVERFERRSDRRAATSRTGNREAPGNALRNGDGDLLSEEHTEDTNTTTPTTRAVRWAGVDWSWTDHAVCVVDDAGAVVERLTVKHTAAGLARLVTGHGIARARRGRGGDRARRRTGGAGPLDADLPVFVVASRQVTALRTRYGTAGNKDDRFDAYLLADVLRTDRRRLTALTVDRSETLGLRMLIRARQDLVEARVAAHNQLRAHLLTAFPGAAGMFAHLDAGISLAFLTWFPTPQHARWLSEKRLASWLAGAHYTARTRARRSS